MKVALLGAAGQVGAAVIRAQPQQHELAAFTRGEIDVCDEARLASTLEALRPDVVINAAAYTAVDRAETEESRAQQVNADAPLRLARVCAGLGARLIHLSTDYVFDGESKRAYRPTDATQPLNAYGRTKLAGERAVASALPRASIILRTSWVYAPTGHNFVRTMLRLMAEKGSVRVVADQIGSPTAADSIADVLWRFVARPECAGLYHWTDAGVASWYDFAVAVAEEGGATGMLPSDVVVTPIASEEYPTPARRPRLSLLDSSQTLRDLGVSAIHWRVWLRRVLGDLRRA
jgi:dTDP-4-dehydrorhamnose reductase